MALQKIFCPSCKQSFFASDRIGSLVECANCGQSLEVTADSVRVCQPATPVNAVQNFQKKSSLPGAKPFPAPRKTTPSQPAESVTQQVSPPELESKSPSSRLSFGTDQLQTAVWKFILPVGLAFVFVATVTTLARQALKRIPAEESKITLRNTSPVKSQQVKVRTSQNQRSTFYPPPSKTTGSGDVVQNAFQSVAVILDKTWGCGTGFVVDKNLLVTNCHVINQISPDDIRLIFPDCPALAGQSLSVELLELDPVNDLAVLSFEADVPPLVVNSVYEHKKGQLVTVIGTPGTGTSESLANFPTDGRLGPPVGDRWSLSLPVNGGNSGGPVIDRNTGEVIAVVVAKYSRTEGQSLAIPHQRLLEVIGRARDAGDERIQEEMIELRTLNCFYELNDILIEETKVFDKSKNAFVYDLGGTLASRVSAFNKNKGKQSAPLSKLHAKLETQLATEINFLEEQGSGLRAAVEGLKSLRESIDHQADKLRESVTESSCQQYFGELNASLEHSWQLVYQTADLLHTRPNYQD